MRQKLSKENLIIPQIILDPESGKEVVIGFDAKSLLVLRESDQNLSGILTSDSAKWGTIPIQPHKARRWGQRGRLVKRLEELRQDNSTRYRYTFAEKSEWEAALSEDEQHWLSSLLEVDFTLYQEQRNQCVRRLATAISEVARLQVEPPQKPKKKKVRRKKKRGYSYANL